jgi:hypothetical protein
MREAGDARLYVLAHGPQAFAHLHGYRLERGDRSMKQPGTPCVIFTGTHTLEARPGRGVGAPRAGAEKGASPRINQGESR